MKKIINSSKLFERFAAFTLAEVLITLSVIGIIAALTIPAMIEKTQNQEYITGLKKAYSETNQALKLLASDYGCPGDLKCTGLFASDLTDADKAFGDELVKYFHISKNCRTAQNQGCWSSSLISNYDGTGTINNNDNITRYKFITADGMSFIIRNYVNDCKTDGSGGSTNYSTGRTGDMSQTCAIVYIDVNGLKKPNILGRDTFVFYITNGKGPMLYPCGGSDSNYGGFDHWWQTASTCTVTNKAGSTCAARVMEEGWQMNY